MSTDPLLEKVETTIQKFQLLCPGSRVVVGVSGGPDSTVLLHILYRLQKKYDLKLWAAYLNHCIRGEEAREEQEWVKHFIYKLEIPLISDSIDVPLLAREKGVGIEFAAREARYNFLEHVANQVGASRIAVGHTASDQAETLLMRLIRGSGLNGLTGIPPLRGRIIRPLIEVFRWEIEEYCQRHKIIPKEDSSNKDLSFFRNSIRFELIPYLTKHYNPRLVEILAQTADLLRADRDFLEDTVIKAQKRVVKRKTDKRVVINAKILSQLHPSLQRRLIRRIIEKLKGNLEGIEYTHIYQILNLREGKGTKLVSLPNDLRVWRQYNELILTRGELSSPGFFSYIQVPGKTELSQLNMTFEAEMISQPATPFSGHPYQAFLDFDKISEPLFVRPRKRGDKFRPLGMKGEKKLKDFFIDIKLPRLERDKVPILVSGKEIVWVVGYRIDERFKVDTTTRKILKIKVTLNVPSSADK